MDFERPPSNVVLSHSSVNFNCVAVRLVMVISLLSDPRIITLAVSSLKVQVSVRSKTGDVPAVVKDVAVNLILKPGNRSSVTSVPSTEMPDAPEVAQVPVPEVNISVAFSFSVFSTGGLGSGSDPPQYTSANDITTRVE